MAKFKCNLSGNIFEFVHAFDIDEMRAHPQYTEVVEEDAQEEKQEKVKKPRKAKEAK